MGLPDLPQAEPGCPLRPKPPFAASPAGRQPDGKLVSEKGKYVTAWKKQKDGTWKAIHDMWNSDARRGCGVISQLAGSVTHTHVRHDWPLWRTRRCDRRWPMTVVLSAACQQPPLGLISHPMLWHAAARRSFASSAEAPLDRGIAISLEKPASFTQSSISEGAPDRTIGGLRRRRLILEYLHHRSPRAWPSSA